VETCKVEAYKARIEALEARLKVCMTTMGNGGCVKESNAPKVNAPQPPTLHRARSEREINNFIWGLEAYFGTMGIEGDAQNVSNYSVSFSRTLPWCSGVVGVTTSSEVPIPSSYVMSLRGNSRNNSITKMPSMRLELRFDTSNTKMSKFESMSKISNSYSWSSQA